MAFMMLSQGWKAVDVLRTFRTRRDVRPNDAFLSQLADLVSCSKFKKVKNITYLIHNLQDNDLRKHREHGISRKLTLATLNEVSTLPKPYHFEFWQTIPDDLPFQLSHIGESEFVKTFDETASPQPDKIDKSPIPDSVFSIKSDPINIHTQPLKPHLLLTNVFQTSEERQEVVLPSPGKSRYGNQFHHQI